MKRLLLLSMICASVAAAYSPASAFAPDSVKILPYGVDFPLIAPSGYESPTGDLFQRSFGIRRWLRPTGSEEDNFQKTLQETYKWHQIYGGYGVLGHGEEVFTNQAERWRRSHRGR